VVAAGEPRLSLLVLTEDSGEQGWATIAALLRHALRLVAPGHDERAIRLEPLDDERLRHLSHGTNWKSRRPEDVAERKRLCRRIAGSLVQAARPGFVVFHIDGDRAWSARATSENRQKFAELIERPIRELVQRNVGSAAPGAVAEALGRLFLWMPFYSVEAWLYQNTEEAIRILHEQHGGSHVFLFEAWRQNRALLDEVIAPKEKTVTPLGALHNHALASGGFPAAEAEAAERSFAEAVAGMRRCAALVAALG
jgi:hypothetical protein